MINSGQISTDETAKRKRVEFYQQYRCQSIIQAMGGAEHCASLPVYELENHPASDNLTANLELLAENSVWAGIYDSQWKRNPYFIINLKQPDTGEGVVVLVYDNTVIGASNTWAVKNLTKLGPKFPSNVTVSELMEILKQMVTKQGWTDGQDNWVVDSGLSKKN